MRPSSRQRSPPLESASDAKPVREAVEAADTPIDRIATPISRLLGWALLLVVLCALPALVLARVTDPDRLDLRAGLSPAPGSSTTSP